MTGFFLVMMPLLIALGHWQVQRGDYKRLLENQYLAKLTELPQTPNSETLSQPFQALRLAGRYHPETFMVDNQVSEGETGYWVYQVFEDDRVGRVLINRGFVASSDRQRLPDVSTPGGELLLTATVWPQLGLIPAWGSQEWAKDWPKRIQRANVVRMSAEAGAWPAELRLEPGQPSPWSSSQGHPDHGCFNHLTIPSWMHQSPWVITPQGHPIMDAHKPLGYHPEAIPT